MAVPIQTHASYSDPVGKKRRRIVVWRFGATALVVVASIAGCARLIGGIFGVTDIVVSGSPAIPRQQVIEAVRQYIGDHAFGLLGASGALPLVGEKSLQKHLESAFPAAREIAIAKNYPHTLTVTLTERTPMGIWCQSERCQFFDRSGAQWGEALQSRGPLLLLVRDERLEHTPTAPIIGALAALADGLPELGVQVLQAKLPDAAPGDLYLATGKGYELMFDAFGDIADQLGTLRILLTEKTGDIAFSPLYIDLRTPGRVYYK